MPIEPIDPALVGRRLTAAGIELDSPRAQKLAAFLSLLGQWGRTYNLTSVLDVEDMIARHLVESLALAPLLEGTRIADIGTGAGLPGLPLAIAEETRQFTLIESRAKRVRFMRHVIASLGITNAVVAHSRVEDLPTAVPFDTVLARAVAPPAKLLEIARPLTAPGSILLLLTAAHLGDSFRGLAADFRLCVPAAALPGALASAVVLLRREPVRD